MRRSLLCLGALAVLLAVADASCFAAKRAPKKKKAKAGASRSASGGGGGFGGGARTSKVPVDSLDPQLGAALQSRCSVLQQDPTNSDAWLQAGAILVKAFEYGEAERVFRTGACRFPEHEMLSAAALTLGGDSAAYLGDASDSAGGAPRGAAAVLDPLSDDSFTSFEAPLAEVLREDQADRAVQWSAAGAEALSARGVVHRSNGPLIDPEACAWVVREVEAHCAAAGGWSTARHVEAPTTDVPVSQVPAIRGWFDGVLRDTLFPMLAARYPYAISSADELRVMDAFVVRYDAAEQASLPTHQDENTFSFTIALNDRAEYEGGGTGFDKLRPAGSADDFARHVLNADAGGVVTFPGKLPHGGNTVTSGRRYIIPLFIYSDRNGSGRKQGYVLDSLGIKPPAGEAAQLSRYAEKVVAGA